MYDQVGYGFHRYSTDSRWLVPHFEKMLYDQAILTIAYLEAYEATGNIFYSKTAREILDYVLRDMTSEKGGFFSAEDADSKGEEGKFYVWSTREIETILGVEDAEIFNSVFNIQINGNSTVEGQRTNIPHLTKTFQDLAKKLNIKEKVLLDKLEKIRKQLFNSREKRVHPYKDDKILTDWNGLMIAALAKAAIVLNEPVYLDAAEKAAEFVLHSISKGERLLKRYRNGVAALDAHLDDYAFMAWGLLELYEATFATKYLSQALDLMNIMVEDFWDDKNGGFFLGSDQSEKLIIRSKTAYDGAIPSGNSVAVMNMVKLTRITGNIKWAELAEKTIRAFSEDVNRTPTGYTLMLTGFMFDTQNSKEIVIVGDSRNRNTTKFLHTIRASYAPHKVLLFKDTSVSDNRLEQLANWTSTQNSINGKPTAYVCKNFACNQPTSDIQTALSFINE